MHLYNSIPQKQGKYPVPKGESEIMGLEAAGEVVAVPPSSSSKWEIGEKVMALLAGRYCSFYVRLYVGGSLDSSLMK